MLHSAGVAVDEREVPYDPDIVVADQHTRHRAHRAPRTSSTTANLNTV